MMYQYMFTMEGMLIIRETAFVWGGTYRKYLSLNFTVNLTLLLKKIVLKNQRLKII